MGSKVEVESFVAIEMQLGTQIPSRDEGENSIHVKELGNSNPDTREIEFEKIWEAMASQVEVLKTENVNLNSEILALKLQVAYLQTGVSEYKAGLLRIGEMINSFRIDLITDR